MTTAVIFGGFFNYPNQQLKKFKNGMFDYI